MSFDSIPQELKIYAQWCVWRFEDTSAPKPTKVPYSANTGRLCSVTNPETWSTYEQAVLTLTQSDAYAGLGFVLTNNDPFAFIDLDKPKDEEETKNQVQIYNEFESYAEKSPSKTGLHIIVKGSIPSGRRRSSIEIYSSERYMTMTGDVYRASPIKDYNELLNALHYQIGASRTNVQQYYNGDDIERQDDQTIIGYAETAANGEKFKKLYTGEWQEFYQSQSEADFSLVNIIAFYTQNKQQITRIFLGSALGQREKAKRGNYLEYMLNRCFDNISPPIDLDNLHNAVIESLKLTTKENNLEAALTNKKQTENLKPEKSIYSLPPGLVGDIAKFIYEQAPRPVPEIALAGAIAFMAGIVGKSYNVSATGLNQYVLMLAGTGRGKEAIADGYDKLINACSASPNAKEFMGPGEIASPQALIKYMSAGNSCFVSLLGEFGLKMQQMAAVNAQPHLVGLRRLLLDLYGKSGQGKVLRPSIYADKEKNTEEIQSPSFSILGESTPEKFYEGLHEGLIAEGLLPRFTLIEYHGHRPPFNKQARFVKPSFDLVNNLTSMFTNCLTLNSQGKVVDVLFTQQAEATFDKFDIYCDNKMNSENSELNSQLWNRAHLKSMKLSALIAVGCNPYKPEITDEQAQWAIDIVIADVNNLLAKFNNGEIGSENEENKQVDALVKGIRFYLLSAWPEIEKYCSTNGSAIHSHKIIPYGFIQRKLAATAAFRKDKMGPTIALKRTLTTLCNRGDLQEIPKSQMHKDFGTTAICYAVTNPDAFKLNLQ